MAKIDQTEVLISMLTESHQQELLGNHEHADQWRQDAQNFAYDMPVPEYRKVNELTQELAQLIYEVENRTV